MGLGVSTFKCKFVCTECKAYNLLPGLTCLLGTLTASQVNEMELGCHKIPWGPVWGLLLQHQTEDGM